MKFFIEEKDPCQFDELSDYAFFNDLGFLIFYRVVQWTLRKLISIESGTAKKCLPG